MNFVHREFVNAATRRAQLYRSEDLRNAKLAADAAPRTILAPWNPTPARLRGGYGGRIVGRFFGLGAVSPPDYGAMLMQPTASPGYTPPSWLDQASVLVKQAIPVWQQAQLLREQQKRRAAGLPPLSADQLAPTVRVQAGLDPGLMKLALYGAVGIGAALILPKLLK